MKPCSDAHLNKDPAPTTRYLNSTIAIASTKRANRTNNTVSMLYHAAKQ